MTTITFEPSNKVKEFPKLLSTASLDAVPVGTIVGLVSIEKKTGKVTELVSSIYYTKLSDGKWKPSDQLGGPYPSKDFGFYGVGGDDVETTWRVLEIEEIRLRVKGL